MNIQVKRFGTVLLSRPSGKEAYLALQTQLRSYDKKTDLILDFSGVEVLTPSWADEFITPLKNTFGEKVVLTNTGSATIKATLEILDEAHKAAASN